MPKVAGSVRLEILDLPALRDADLCVPSFYWGIAPMMLEGEYRGAGLYESLDGGSTYELVAVTQDELVIGITVDEDFAPSTLPDSPVSDCPRWDNESTVKVTMLTPGATLSSVTDEDIRLGAHRAVIGNEIVAFRDAVLVARQTYELSGFWRGLRGTDAEFSSGHGSGERFVLLDSNKLNVRHYDRTSVDTERWFKGVPVGGDPTNYTGFPVRLLAQNMRDFSVHQVETSYVAGDLVSTWVSRTRSILRLTRMSPQGACCCEQELYEVDLIDKGATTVAQTYPDISAGTLTIPTADLTAAGYTPPEAITLDIYRISDAVGRGFKRAVVSVAS